MVRMEGINMQHSWYFDELIGGTEPWHTITQCVTEVINYKKVT